MKLIKSKEGAIELSMTTIIVIVLGITLLVLGSTWVYQLFGKVSTLTEDQFTAAQKLIMQQMNPGQKFYINGLSFDVEPGKSTTVYIGIQNFGKEGTSNKFKMEVSPGEGASASWFTVPQEQEIEVGAKKGIPLSLKVPKGTQPGSSFSFTIKALKDGQFYDSDSIIVNVKEA